MQKLMTGEIAKGLPRPYEQDGAEDPMVYVHYFSCVSGWDWWLAEYDPATGEAFGLVRGFATEWGLLLGGGDGGAQPPPPRVRGRGRRRAL